MKIFITTLTQNAIKPFFLLIFLSTALFCSSSLKASEIRHYKGEEIKNTEQALTILQSYNAELQTLLNKEKLQAKDMGKIHEMTYTMENALQKLADSIAKTQQNLEELHLSSETLDEKKVRDFGKNYLAEMSTFTEKK